MRTPKNILAVCLLLSGAGCAASPGDHETSPSTGHEATPNAIAADGATRDFGDWYHFAGGLSIAVSKPKSFHPSPSAYPRSERGLAFEIAVDNDTREPYQLSGMSARATAGGQPAKQLLDSTQGFTGIADASQDVPPSHKARVNVAFAAPPQPTQLRLMLRPNVQRPATVTYVGSA